MNKLPDAAEWLYNNPSGLCRWKAELSGGSLVTTDTQVVAWLRAYAQDVLKAAEAQAAEIAALKQKVAELERILDDVKDEIR